MKFEVTRKVLKGNYLSLNNKRLVPVNEEKRRILMPEYGEIKIFILSNRRLPYLFKEQKICSKNFI